MGLWQDLTGGTASDASNAAAADTYAKQKAATGAYQAYGNTLPGQYNQIAQGYTPYVNAGNSALSMLQSGLGLGGAQGSQDFTNAYHALPGYQSGLDTGTTAALRGLNAGGPGLQSGAALKALTRFGSDYENQRSGDYLSRLGGLASSGLSATQGQVGTEAQGIGANTGVQGQAYGGEMNSAGTIGQGLVAGAQAKQQGIGNIMNAAAYLGGAALSGGTSLAMPMKKMMSFGTGPGAYGS